MPHSHIKVWLALLALAVLVCGIFLVEQWLYVEKAHSTFDDYYAFRGCEKLIDKTDTYADCELASGETIRIVEVGGQWYLDGDLPCPGPVGLKYFLCVI